MAISRSALFCSAGRRRQEAFSVWAQRGFFQPPACRDRLGTTAASPTWAPSATAAPLWPRPPTPQGHSLLFPAHL